MQRLGARAARSRCQPELGLAKRATTPPPLPPPPTPPLVPRSGYDANASGDRSFGGRSSQDEDRLDPSPPMPRSQRGPKPPVNLYHHHSHSHHSPHNHTTAAGIAALAANALFARNLTPGKYSFHTKVAVAVGAANTAIAITSGKYFHQ